MAASSKGPRGACEGRVATAVTTTATTTTTGTVSVTTVDNATTCTTTTVGSSAVVINRNSSSPRQGSVDSVMQRCGLCSLISRLVRRAMCVGSRRGSGESYYQELAETTVSQNQFYLILQKRFWEIPENLSSQFKK